MKVEVQFFNRAAEQFPTLQSWQHVVGVLDEFALRQPVGVKARRSTQVERDLFAHLTPRLLRLGWRVGNEIPLCDSGGGRALWPHFMRKRTALLLTQPATLPLLGTLAKAEVLSMRTLLQSTPSKRAVIAIAGDLEASDVRDAKVIRRLVSVPLAIAVLQEGNYSPLRSREELYRRVGRARAACPETQRPLKR